MFLKDFVTNLFVMTQTGGFEITYNVEAVTQRTDED